MSNLLVMINEKRHEMIELANKYGFSSKEAVECSQQLDTLLNLLLKEEQNSIQSNKVNLPSVRVFVPH